MASKAIILASGDGSRRMQTAPILMWSLLIIPFLAATPMNVILASVVRHTRKQPLLQLNRGAVPLPTHFYGIHWLHQVCIEAVASFDLLPFDQDSPRYWQALDYLAQYGSIYAALLLETCRRSRGPKRLLLYVPCIYCSQKND
jgi:hypothetical protein